jgi:hypothetical protein
VAVSEFKKRRRDTKNIKEVILTGSYEPSE